MARDFTSPSTRRHLLEEAFAYSLGYTRHTPGFHLSAHLEAWKLFQRAHENATIDDLLFLTGRTT